MSECDNMIQVGSYDGHRFYECKHPDKRGKTCHHGQPWSPEKCPLMKLESIRKIVNYHRTDMDRDVLIKILEVLGV